MNPRNRKPINRGSPSVAAPPGVSGAGTPLPGRTGQADELKELLAFERAAMLEARSTEHVMQKKLAEAQAGRGKPGEAARSAMGRAKAPRNRDQPSSALMNRWESHSPRPCPSRTLLRRESQLLNATRSNP